MPKLVAAACLALALLVSGCGGYDTSAEVAADLPCTGTRDLTNAFFGQPGTLCFMLGGANPNQDSIQIIASEGDDLDALVRRGVDLGAVYLVGDGFIATGPVSLLGKAHTIVGGKFQ
jgi:hypothetical protein